VLSATALRAQVTAAAGYVPPDDNPSIRIGATIYTDYTLTQKPKIKDADGDSVSLSAFNVSRAYININGNISHLMAFRITPDVSRETGAGASLAGSLEFRIKYAFGQFNLDDWTTKGSWIRFGINQTPYLDFIEGIYRYRFQSQMESERDGALTSSDGGISAHWNIPNNYGDIHVGYYNGDGYSKAEVNNQKALQARFTLRPFATMDPLLRGFRATFFYDGDHPVANAPRTRSIGALTYEHQYFNLGAELLSQKDRASALATAPPAVEAKGMSFWANPKTGATNEGWEGLIRYDHYTPNNTNTSQVRKRTIVGVTYWIPHTGNVSSAWMLDWDSTQFDAFTPAQPTQTKIAIHGLINY
jgi:hypothetical protein